MSISTGLLKVNRSSSGVTQQASSDRFLLCSSPQLVLTRPRVFTPCLSHTHTHTDSNNCFCLHLIRYFNTTCRFDGSLPRADLFPESPSSPLSPSLRTKKQYGRTSKCPTHNARRDPRSPKYRGANENAPSAGAEVRTPEVTHVFTIRPYCTILEF